MPRPWALLFDLDGTLIDSIELLLASVRYAFVGHLGRAPTREEWIAGIGTPLVTQLRPFAADDAELRRLVERYRAYQREYHDSLTAPYPGVVETLRLLRARGHPMAVVTSKGDELARRSVAHVGLAELIDDVVGCDSCSRHKPEPEPVLVALERLGYGAHEALFLGDSVHDVASGNAAGVVTVAALWGPFSREILARAEPTHMLEHIRALPALIERVTASVPG